jgi:hypothetical protein
VMVFTNAIFFEAASSSLLAGLTGVADASKARRAAASDSFLTIFLGTR